ncbi:hypothetical protein [Paraclostridium bifermentans]|nr:hypothetical protein [Paraclostridium bifermentans]
MLDKSEIKVYKNISNGTMIGDSINQESVDLNSYLYKELYK